MATSGPSEIPPKGSSGADGSEGSLQWSLKRDDQVKNLKETFSRVFKYCLWMTATITSPPWFETVVDKLRADPCIEVYGLEIEPPNPFFKSVRSLHVAVMMGDEIMVHKVLEARCTRNNVTIDARTGGGDLTALHMAVIGGDGKIVDALLQLGADVNAGYPRQLTPLDCACKVENFSMLEELLKKDPQQKHPLHAAARAGNIDFMRALPVQNVNALDRGGRTPLHYLAMRTSSWPVSDIVQHLTKDNSADVTVLDDAGYSVFYLAVLSRDTKLVMALLASCKEKLRLNEVCCQHSGPPIQIAYESGHRSKDIEELLMECDPVKSYIEALYRDRQIFVDAANALLVGAALIASVTFASWLQPPLSYTSYSGGEVSSNVNYVDVQHNLALRAFWIFNALSFYFAIATVVCGARSVLPRRQLFIKDAVERLAGNLSVTAILLACSVLFVIVAFGISGTVVLTPLLKYQCYMIVPTVGGGFLCVTSLGYLFKTMWENLRGRGTHKQLFKHNEVLETYFSNYEKNLNDGLVSRDLSRQPEGIHSNF